MVGEGLGICNKAQGCMINSVQSLEDRGGCMHLQQVTIINYREKSGLKKLLSSHSLLWFFPVIIPTEQMDRI
jgi:hypothetical protein